MDLFRGKKIKKLLERISAVTSIAEAGEAVDELQGYGKQGLQGLIDYFQRRKINPVMAEQLFEKICDDSCQADIAPLLGDPHDEVRRIARAIIIEKWSKTASPFLLELLKGSDLYGRNNAVELLTLFKDQTIVNDLVGFYKEAAPEGKKSVIKILASVNGTTGKKLIMNALSDGDWQVRLAAVKALSKMQAPESVEPLIERLADKEPHMRTLALDALTSIGDKRAAKPVLELLRDDDLLVRQQATDCLIRVADSTIVPDLIQLMRQEDVNIRRCVVEVLKHLKDPRTADELLLALKDSDWWVREIATSSLAELKGDNNIVKAFVSLSRDPDENIRRCAMEFFSKIADPSTYDILIERLDDTDWWVREKALGALSRLHDKRALPHLARMSDDATVGWVVPGALAATGDKKALAQLKELLFHRSKRVRIEAIKAVAGLNSKDWAPLLQKCLTDADEEVRTEAAAALKNITGKGDKPAASSQEMLKKNPKL